MLSQFYKIIVVNNSGVTVDWDSGGRIELNVDGWIIDPTTGKITYSNILDDVSSTSLNGAGESVINGAEILFEEISNTSNLFLGAQIQLKVIHDGGTAADGTFDMFLDGGRITAELASDSTGYASAEANKLQIIGSLTWEPNGLDDEVMRSNVFNI